MSAAAAPPGLEPAQKQGISPGPLVAYGVLFVLALIALVASMAGGLSGLDLGILSLALLTGLIGIAPILIMHAMPFERRHLVLGVSVVSYTVYLVLPAFTQYFLEADYDMGVTNLHNIDPIHIIGGQLAALTGLMCLLLGYFSPIAPAMASVVPRTRNDWPHDTAILVATAMLTLGLLVFVLGQMRMIPKQVGSGALGAVASGMYFSIALFAIIRLRYNSRTALMVLVLVLPPMMGVSFLSGSKRLFLTPAAMVALGSVLVERRLRLSWLLAAVGAITVLYPLSEFYRQVVLQGLSLGAADVVRNPGRALSLVSSFMAQVEPLEYFRAGFIATGNRLDALGILCVIVRDTPERVPYQGGWTIGLIFLSYIPRLFWPGKPDTTIGQWVTDNFGSGPLIESNTGPTWIGELYFNFGYLGVIGGMILFGMFLRLLHETSFRGRATVPALLVGVIVLYAIGMSVQGGLIGPLNGVAYNVVPVVLTHFTLRWLMRGRLAPRPAD